MLIAFIIQIDIPVNKFWVVVFFLISLGKQAMAIAIIIFSLD
jgi:hypothetical protein